MEEEHQIEIQDDDTFVDDGEIVVNLSGRHLDCWNEIQAEDTFEDNIDGDNIAAADLVVLIQMMMVSASTNLSLSHKCPTWNRRMRTTLC